MALKRTLRVLAWQRRCVSICCKNLVISSEVQLLNFQQAGVAAAPR